MLHESYGVNHISILGELLASSTMGVTLFDLFGEIVSQTDLKYFLRHCFYDFLTVIKFRRLKSNLYLDTVMLNQLIRKLFWVPNF